VEELDGECAGAFRVVLAFCATKSKKNLRVGGGGAPGDRDFTSNAEVSRHIEDIEGRDQGSCQSKDCAEKKHRKIQ
jgi:hypothetical protein